MPALFPETVVDPEIIESTAEETQFGRNVGFDFEHDEFAVSPTGRQYKLDETDSWIEWAIKALATPRYQHLIYSDNYGSEFHTLIGTCQPHEFIESEIRRMTKECLMVDDRTEKVDEFEFEWIDDGVMFTCKLTSVRGETRYIGGKVVI